VPTPAPIIGICGPVGSGKSTLLPALAVTLGFRSWPERTTENPFFERFAREAAAWAFHSQVAFVLGAVEDAAAARRTPPGGVLERPAEEMLGVFVRDLRARALLDADELEVLARLVALGETLAGPPDLLIVLEGPPELLLGRIRARGGPGDGSYDLADVRRLADAYDRWRAEWTRCPVIDVPIADLDMGDTREIAALAARVRIALGLV
jgi:deoxyguanosine kinase